MAANAAPYPVVSTRSFSVSRVAACNTPWNALPEVCSSVDGHTLGLRLQPEPRVHERGADDQQREADVPCPQSGTLGRWSGKTATLIG